MHQPWSIVVLMVGALIGAGCAPVRYQPMARPDSDGVPLIVTADFDPAVLDHPAFVPAPEPTVRFLMVHRVGWPGRSPWCDDPFWPHGHLWADQPRPTAVWLLLGDGPAQAQALRWRLGRGAQETTVAIRPGRTVTVTMQANGGQTGWESLGTITMAPGLKLRVVLDAHGGRLDSGSATSAAVTAP